MKVYILLVAILATASASVAVDELCIGVPPDEVVLFPFPGDCTKYYECAEGIKTEMHCPEGLWFNEAVQTCDHPEHSGCKPEPITDSTSVSTSSVTKDPRCPSEGIDYLPYLYDCTKYIECYNGEPEVFICPDGLWFNAREKRCVYPKQSGCEQTTSSTWHPTWTTPDAACWGILPGETVLIPYPGDCNRFIECYGAQRTDMRCPPHLYFNYARQLCDWPDVSGCDDSTTTVEPEPTGTTTGPISSTTPSGDDDPRCASGDTDYWPHPECDKYVECYRGHGYTMQCPTGLYFNSIDKKCVNPSDSDCGHTSPVTPYPISTTTRDNNWTPDPDCHWPSSERYLFPYPGDCTKFWECAEGEKVVAYCPDHLWFNPILLVCDYPYHSGCVWEV